MSTRFLTADELSALDKWYVIDAADQVLGRVATKAATILTGKHRPRYAPFLVSGDHVIILNAEKIRLTGEKLDKKVYRHHTLYPGGLRVHFQRLLVKASGLVQIALPVLNFPTESNSSGGPRLFVKLGFGFRNLIFQEKVYDGRRFLGEK